MNGSVHSFLAHWCLFIGISINLSSPSKGVSCSMDSSSSIVVNLLSTGQFLFSGSISSLRMRISNIRNIRCFRWSLSFSGSSCVPNSNSLSFVWILWRLSQRVNWPHKSPSSWVSWYLSITSSLVHSGCNNSFLFVESSGSSIWLWFGNSSIWSFLESFLFSNNRISCFDSCIKRCPIFIWCTPRLWIKLRPVWSVMSCHPLVMVNIIFNLFLEMLGSSLCILIEGVLSLFVHCSSMSRCSFLFGTLFSWNNFCSFLNSRIENSSVRVWSSLGKILMMMMMVSSINQS